MMIVGLLALTTVQDRGVDPVRPPRPSSYLCPFTTTKIKVDGKLDDPAWSSAPWSEPFVDIVDRDGKRPRFATRMKMTWDDEALYIAAELEEPDVWATLTKHDAVIFRDNDFEVFLDPDGDNHEYVEFEINALNTGWDLFLPKPYRDGGKPDDSFELAGLKTAVHVDGTINDPRDVDKGWTVEIMIPWKAVAAKAGVACPPAEGDRWRANFSRVEWRTEVKAGKTVKLADVKEENSVWSPQGAVDMHRPERWGYVQFTRLPADQATLANDPLGPARDRLIVVYNAQKAFQTKNKRWATSVRELGLSSMSTPPIVIRITDGGGYEAEAGIIRGDDVQPVTINHESKIVVHPLRTGGGFERGGD